MPDYQGKGYGSALVKFAKDFGRSVARGEAVTITVGPAAQTRQVRVPYEEAAPGAKPK